MAEKQSKFVIAYEILATDNYSATLKKFGMSASAVDRALRGMTYAGGALVGVGTMLGGSLIYATTQASLFEREMSAVKAVSGASGREFQALSDKAREMGKATSFNAQEASQGLKYLALAGWDTAQMLAGIEPVLYLAEAGNIDLALASDLASDSMSGLGIGANDAEYYLDRVAQTSRNANTEIVDLMHAYRIGGGQLSSLNVPLEESATLFGVMANRGFKGAQAGRAMNAIIQNMTTGFGRAGDAMEEINVSAFDSQGKFRGLEATFRDIIRATKDMNDEDRNRIYAMIAGKEHIKTFNAILNGMGAEYDSLKVKNINATGALREMRNEMKNNLIGSIERMNSAFKELAISFGELLIPMVRSVVDSLEDLFNWLNNMAPATKKLIAYAVAFGSALTVLSGVALITVGIFGQFVTAMGALGISVLPLIKSLGVLGAMLSTIAYVGFKGYQKEAGRAIDTTVDFGEAVSDTTAEAVEGYRAMADEVTNSTRELAYGQVTITKESASKMLAEQERFTEASLANIDHRLNAEMDRATNHLEKMGKLDEESKREVLSKIEEHYNNEKKIVENAQKSVTALVELAESERRALTEQELNAIEAIRAQAQEATIKAIAKDQEELLAIQQAYADTSVALELESVAKVVASARERKDEVIAIAEEEHAEAVAWAILQRDEIGSITAEEADEYIRNANRQKEAVVDSAMQTYEETIAIAQQRAGENVDLVNWETGEMYSGWELFVLKMKGKWEEFKGIFSDIAEVFKQIVIPMEGMFDALTQKFSSVVAKWENLWETHGDKIMWVVEGFTKVIVGIITVVINVVSLLVMGFLDGLIRMIEGALDVITGIFDFFSALFQGDWRGMWEAIVNIVKGFIQMIIGFIEVFFTRGLGGAFKKFATNALKNTTKLVTDLVKGIRNGISKMFEAGVELFHQILRAIFTKSPEARKEAGKMVKDTLKKFTDKIGDFFTSGKDMINGVIRGMAEMGTKAVDKAKQIGSDIYKSVTNFFKIKSPSRLMMEVGGFIILGMSEGMEGKRGEAKRTARSIAEDIHKQSLVYAEKDKEIVEKYSLDKRKAELKYADDVAKIHENASKEKRKLSAREVEDLEILQKEHHIAMRDMERQFLDNRNKLIEDANKEAIKTMEDFVNAGKKNGTIRLNDEIVLWNELRRQQKIGSEAYEKMLENHQNAVKELRSRMEKTNEEYSKRIIDIDRKLIEDTKKLNEEYYKAFESRYNELNGFAGIFDSVSREDVEGEDLIKGMESQVKALDDFMASIQKLDGRVDNKEFIEELKGMGVKSVDEIQALTKMSDDELDKFVKLFEEKSRLATYQATKELEPLKHETQQAIKNMELITAREMELVKQEWQKAIEDIVVLTEREFDSMQQVGVDAIQGLADGMISMESQIKDVASGMAFTIAETIAQVLDIRSPSRKLMEMGMFVGEGLRLGVLGQISKLSKASEKMAQAIIPEVETIVIDYDMDSNLHNLEFLTGDGVKVELNDMALVDSIDRLIDALGEGDGEDGFGVFGDINVQIDGRTVETMQHARDFFTEIKQEVRKRKR